MIVISDIDGTLAKINASRINLLANGKWVEFSAGVTQDRPIRPVVRLLQLLYQRGLDIHLHTSRGEECRAATEDWLWSYNIPYSKLLMRPVENMQPDYLLKWDYIRKNNYNKSQVFCVFEDRSRCVQLYRSLGLLCLQVAQNAGVDQQQRGNRVAYQDFQTRVATHLSLADFSHG